LAPSGGNKFSSVLEMNSPEGSSGQGFIEIQSPEKKETEGKKSPPKSPVLVAQKSPPQKEKETTRHTFSVESMDSDFCAEVFRKR